MQLGEELGRGVRAVVYAWGEHDVVKVAVPDTPDGWLADELRLSDAVARTGAAIPGRRELIAVDGRLALRSERIVGPSMWQLLVDDPGRADELGVQLAEVQLDVARHVPSYELPAQRDRLTSKIRAAAARHGADLLEALRLLPPDDDPVVLCHGDLHPRNVLLSDAGPVLVDWFDASRGALAADVARTELVLAQSAELGAPAVDATAIRRMQERFLAIVLEQSPICPTTLDRWRLVQSIARLAEGLGDHDVDALRSALRAATT